MRLILAFLMLVTMAMAINLRKNDRAGKQVPNKLMNLYFK